MNQNYLLVLDLDHTLLPVDSFKRWILKIFLESPSRLVINLIKARSYSPRVSMKVACIKTFESLPTEIQNKLSFEFGHKLIKKIHSDFFLFLERVKPLGVLVISASPDIYVSTLANQLGFSGKGSHLIHNIFNPLKGENKALVLNLWLDEKKFRDFKLVGVGNYPDDYKVLECCDFAFNMRRSKRQKKSDSAKIIDVKSWASIQI